MVAKDQAPAPNKKAKKTTRPPTGVMVFSKGLTGNRPLIDPDDIHIKPGLNCRDFTSPRMKRHVKNLAYLMLENGFDLSKALHCRYDETEKKSISKTANRVSAPCATHASILARKIFMRSLSRSTR